MAKELRSCSHGAIYPDALEAHPLVKALQARLEAIETAYKLTLEQCAHEQKENARLRESENAFHELRNEHAEWMKEREDLRKVVDAARKYVTASELPSHCVTLTQTMDYRSALREALRELDGECVCAETSARHCPVHQTL